MRTTRVAAGIESQLSSGKIRCVAWHHLAIYQSAVGWTRGLIPMRSRSEGRVRVLETFLVRVAAGLGMYHVPHHPTVTLLPSAYPI